MSDNIFRTKTEPVTESNPSIEKPGKGERIIENDIEPPFTEYERINAKPFLADYYELGDYWKDKIGGYEKEIRNIEGYFTNKINKGLLKNEISVVKERIDRIYSFYNIDKTERVSMQIERLEKYVDFMRKTDHLK